MRALPTPYRSPHLAWDDDWPSEFKTAMHHLDAVILTSSSVTTLPLDTSLHPWMEGTPMVALLLVRGSSGRYYRLAAYAEPSGQEHRGILLDGATRHSDIMAGWSPHLVDIEIMLDDQQAPFPSKVVKVVESLVDDRRMAMREPNIAQFIAASRDQLPGIACFTIDGPERVGA